MSEGYPYHFRGISEKTSDPNAPEKLRKTLEKGLQTDTTLEGLQAYEYMPDEEITKTVEQINEAYKELIRTTDLETYELSVDQVHMLPTDILEDHLASQGQEGAATTFSNKGEVYIPDDLDETEQLNVLSHEFIHVSGQNRQVAIIFKPDSKDGAENFTFQTVERTGVQQAKKDIVNTSIEVKIRGLGLNEAIVELLATRLRSKMKLAKKYPEPFTEKFGKESSAYQAGVRVLEAVVKKYFNDDLAIGSPYFVKLMHLNVAADPSFLRELQVALSADGHKDGLKNLFQMGASYEDAEVTAVKLGLDVEKIFSGLEKSTDEINTEEIDEEGDSNQIHKSPFETNGLPKSRGWHW